MVKIKLLLIIVSSHNVNKCKKKMYLPKGSGCDFVGGAVDSDPKVHGSNPVIGIILITVESDED